MAGKNEKQELSESASTRMFRKAKSFRDDIKSKIVKRSPSNVSSGRASSPSPKKSPKHRRKGLARGGSFNEGCRTDRELKLNDVDKLEQESKKVFQSLQYIQDVVDKNILQLLPGSASVVLETIMEVNQLLGNYFIDQESTVMISTYNQVYQSLANLIRWADYILLHGDDTMDKESASQVIKAVNDGIKELLQLSIDKLEHQGNGAIKRQCSTLAKSPTTRPSSTIERKFPGSSSNGTLQRIKAQRLELQLYGFKCNHRNSLPDIPLTPREKKILEETSQLSFNYPVVPKPSEDIPDNNNLYPDIPPPKPPLPTLRDSPTSNRRSKATPSISESVDPLLTEVPPPLPRKKRNSRTTACDSSSSEMSGQSTLTNIPNIGSPRSLRSQLHSQLYETSQNVTPESKSPTDSVISSLSATSVDSGKPSTNDTNSSSKPLEMRFSHYDNFNVPYVQAIHRSEEIENLTKKIDQLTSKVGLPNSATVLAMHTPGVDSDAPPPLPEKKLSWQSSFGRRQRQDLFSTYDNVASLLSERVNIQHSMNVMQRITHTSQVTQMGTTKLSSQRVVQGMTQSTTCSKQITKKDGESQPQCIIRTGGVAQQIAQSESTLQQHGKVNTTLQASRSAIGFSGINNGQKMSIMTGGFSEAAQVSLSHDRSSSLDPFSETASTHSSSAESLMKPPPLPPKKRHVHDYMKMFGQYTRPSVTDFARHSIHSVNFYQAQWFQHQMEIFHHPVYPRSNTISTLSDISSQNSEVFPTMSTSSSEENQRQQGTPPLLPPKRKSSSTSSAGSRRSDTFLPSPTLPTDQENSLSVALHNGNESKRASAPPSIQKRTITPPPEIQKDSDSDFAELSTLDDVDVSDQLVRKKPTEDGPDIRGGSVDALIVHATTAGKQDFMYQEAFLTTYRTFLTPKELIEKLLYRYNKFSRIEDVKKKKLSRNAFSFLIRVVDELCTEIRDKIIELLMNLVFQLLCDGELMLARILRKKVLEKCELRKQLMDASHHVTLLSSYQLTAKQHILTDFKSEQIAEQMTMLDAELFQKIEIPEVLLWSKEQLEEHSPNLTMFTEHFNKMSYWCRTRILEPEDPKERERLHMKFIKIMKHLRKFNNFNSYLAILSAVDSAPIRRLEWQKQNLEALREFCLLIDTSSSFRAYRQALAETEPPCIPYIGLILQDLTFVHIGNPDAFSDGNINFAKRWQQFNILDNMRRFKKCNYEFKKNQKIVAYFNNFDDCLSEESLWQISKTIKP